MQNDRNENKHKLQKFIFPLFLCFCVNVLKLCKNKKYKSFFVDQRNHIVLDFFEPRTDGHLGGEVLQNPRVSHQLQTIGANVRIHLQTFLNERRKLLRIMRRQFG